MSSVDEKRESDLASLALSRRSFMGWMAALTAVLGTEGCSRQPLEKILPYARMPEEIIPGKPLFYSTTLRLGGEGLGVLVESHMGRPTKIEGNELHPGTLGATNAFLQAAVLELYDPDRSRTLLRDGRPATWSTFLPALKNAIATAQRQGQIVAILTEPDPPPTYFALLQQVLKATGARWYTHDPISRDRVQEGARLAFGTPLEVRYDFSKADVILSFGADFLWGMPGHLAYARQFSQRRDPDNGSSMNRLYVVESHPSLASTMADHRLAVRPTLLTAYLAALAEEVGSKRYLLPFRTGGVSPGHRQWLRAVAADLKRHPGRAVVVAGESLEPAAQAAIHAINEELGAGSQTVWHLPIAESGPRQGLRELVSEMAAGKVGGLLVLDRNPAYDAPADLDFKSAVSRVLFRCHLGLYADETAALCQWHVPQAHALESWGDAVAYDGTASIQQPLIQPLYDGKSALEILSAILGPEKRSYDLVREHWRGKQAVDFEKSWRRWLHDGVIAGTAPARQTRRVTGQHLAASSTMPAASELDLVFRPDYAVWDGRFANNGWLQELPKPLTNLTWDNALLAHPDTLKHHQLQQGDLVSLEAGGRVLVAAVFPMPLMPADTLALSLGYGRERAGTHGTGRGFNAYRLRASDSPWMMTGVRLKKTGREYRLVSVHDHHSMHGRDIARGANLDEYRQHPENLVRKKMTGPLFEPTIDPRPENFPPAVNSGHDYAWGMSVNLNACIGCQSCVVACQSENNIPIVGKDQVERGREMHWLRIDTYYEADRTFQQPVPCMHCETAPCELVCPVGATVHGHEGLNEMVYNRCVGTRYCSNNCPYKVRRFNFYNWKDPRPLIQLRANPDVTIRERGVMEKCTYCVQRINAARIEAEKEGRKIRDGEFTTACAQACPTRAIVFGNTRDPDAEVSKLKKRPFDYELLDDLNTKPRTTYLGKVWNPNPEMKGMS